MSSSWKKDLDDSLRIVKNAFFTGDIHTEFTFTSKQEDPDAEVKNTLKKKRLYVVVLILWLAFSKMISVVGDVIINLLHIPYYSTIPTILRYIIMFISTSGIIVVVWKWRKLNKGAKTVYDEQIIAKAVQEMMPGASFEPDGAINSSKLYSLGVVPGFDNAYGSYLICYQKEGKECRFSNLTLTHMEVDHKNRYYQKAVFVGQAYVLHYKTDMAGYVRIMTTTMWMGKEALDGFRKQDKNREEKIETENQIFNEQFDVYATDAHTAFYVLTPLVMERLLAMKEKYGSFGVAVSGSEIAIALCTGYYLFEAPQSYQGIENISVENSKNEIQQMLVFAQTIENAINGRI